MATINKICIDCGQPFEFRAAEQDFFREHGYADPKRCVHCRRAYKQKYGKTEAVTPDKCFDCNPKMVRGVIVDASDNCIKCGRHIEKSVSQFPVLTHYLRGQDGSA